MIEPTMQALDGLGDDIIYDRIEQEDKLCRDEHVDAESDDIEADSDVELHGAGPRGCGRTDGLRDGKGT